MRKDTGFSIVERNGVTLISVDCINRLGKYRAYYSTGWGGVSDMPGGCTMNLSLYKNCVNDTFENAKENFLRFADACGFELDRMSIHPEVHGSDIAVVRREDIPQDVFDRKAYQPYDGQVSTDKEVALVVYAGDCNTILLADPVHEVHAATHCGWRNNLNGTVAHFLERFRACGGDPETSVLAIGPSISRYYYDLDREMVEPFARAGFSDCLEKNERNGRWFIDLKEITRRQLAASGMPADRIFIAPWCTFSSTELRLPSYRRDRGLNANLGGVLFYRQ